MSASITPTCTVIHPKETCEEKEKAMTNGQLDFIYVNVLA